MDEPVTVERQCRHCRYSVGTFGSQMPALWCWRHDRLDPVPCDDYEREPGADDA